MYIIKKHTDAFILIVAILFIYASSVTFGFVFDDEKFVQKNVYLDSFKYLYEVLTSNITAGSGYQDNFYRPLQHFTHLIDVQIWGKSNPGAHHFTNVLLFIFCGLSALKYLKSRFSSLTAFLCSLIFLLHPLHTENVSFISGRGEIIGLGFFFLGLFYYQKSFLKGLIFFVLAILGKENFVTFSALILIERYLFEKRILKKDLLYLIPSAIYIGLRLTVLNFSNSLNFYNSTNIFTENLHYRIYTFFATLPQAFSLWFFPHDLHHERSFQVFVNPLSMPVFIGFSIVLFVTLSNIKKSWRLNPIFLALLWFLIACSPTSNIAFVINALFYDHWFILPGFSIILLLGILLDRPTPYLRPISSVLTIFFIPLSITYSHVWKSPISFYSHILKYEPKSIKAMNNLGMEYASKGNAIKAKEFYHQALKQNPNQTETLHNLALLEIKLNNHNTAINLLKKAINTNKNFFASWLYLGKLLQYKRRLSEAKLCFEKALKLNPNSLEAKHSLKELTTLQP